MKMTTVSAQNPTPHRRYFVSKRGALFLAMPCYGMHAPYWVPTTGPAAEGERVTMDDADQYVSVTSIEADIAELAEIRKAFEPVADWFNGGGEIEEPPLSSMVGDAAVELVEERRGSNALLRTLRKLRDRIACVGQYHGKPQPDLVLVFDALEKILEGKDWDSPPRKWLDAMATNLGSAIGRGWLDADALTLLGRVAMGLGAMSRAWAEKDGDVRGAAAEVCNAAMMFADVVENERTPAQ